MILIPAKIIKPGPLHPTLFALVAIFLLAQFTASGQRRAGAWPFRFWLI